MTDLRAAAQQALEALDGVLDSYGEPLDLLSISGGAYEALQCREAITALRAALAEPEPPPEAQTEAEKIAYCAGWWDALAKAREGAVTEPVQEPVAVVRSVVGPGDDGVRIKWLGGFPQIGDRLYTSPQQRKPLTEEEILAAVGWERAEMYMKLTPNFPVAEAKKETLKNARAIEQAHGIGSKT